MLPLVFNYIIVSEDIFTPYNVLSVPYILSNVGRYHDKFGELNIPHTYTMIAPRSTENMRNEGVPNILHSTDDIPHMYQDMYLGT